MKDFNSYVSDFNKYLKPMGYDNPYYDPSTASTKVNPNILSLLQKSGGYSNPLPIDNSRSLLNRVIDAVSTPLYATAGFVNGFVDPKTTPFQGFVNGLRAGNPFGQGYDKGEVTYSKVLENAGWQPDTTMGKIAKGALGFVGDVFLDPTTYLSGGASALLKGTGEAGLKVLSREALTFDDAVNIIREQNKARKLTMTDGEIARDAEKFSNEYNRVMGLKDSAPDLTMSLGNAPFGKKIFGSLADKSITLKSGEELQQIGENTVAPLWAKLRDSFYGTKLGQLFSTNSALYNASKADPARLYDFLKFSERTQGLHVNQLDVEKAIREKASQMNMTPAEAKEVLDLMQDKTVWGKISATVKFADTHEAQQMKANILKQHNDIQQTLNDLADKKKNLETLQFAHDSKMVDANQQLNTLREEYQQSLMGLDTNKLTQQEHIQSAIKSFEDELSQLNKAPEVDAQKQIESLLSQHDSYTQQKQAQQEIRDAVTKESEARSTSTLKASVELSDVLKRSVAKDGYVAYKSPRAIEDFIKQHPDWQKVDTEIPHKIDYSTGEILQQGYKETRFYPPQHIIDHAKSVNNKIRSDVTNTVDRPKMIEDLSNYVYGRPDMISPAIWDNNLEKVMNMVREGTSKENIISFMERNPDFYSGRAQTIYPWIAKQVGYGTGTRFANWDEVYTQPMKEIFDRVQKSGVMSASDTARVAELQKLNLKRQYWINKFKNARTMDDVIQIMTDTENKQLEEEYRKIAHLSNTTVKDLPKPEDIRRGEFVKSDSSASKFKTDYTDKTPPEQFLYDSQKQQIANDIADRILFKTRPLRGRDGKVVEVIDGVNKLTSGHVHFIDKVMQEVEPLLKEFFKKDYGSLTERQKNALVSMAMKNTNLRAGGEQLIGGVSAEDVKTLVKENDRRLRVIREEAVKSKVKEGSTVSVLSDKKMHIGEVKSIGENSYEVLKKDGTTINVKPSEVMAVHTDKAKMSVDEIVKESMVTNDFVNRQQELSRLIDEHQNTLKNLDVQYNTSYHEMLSDFTRRADEIKTNIKSLEVEGQNLRDALNGSDLGKVDELTSKITKMEDVLSSDDAFETYMRTVYGDGQINKIIAKNSPGVTRVMLNSDVSAPDKVKQIAQMLRDEMVKIGESEVAIGKLKPEQVENMLLEYLPHIVTPEGAKFFSRNDEVVKQIPNFGDDLGYGRKWNPYSKTRQIKVIPDGNGGFIENPTIEQINEFFRPMLQGKNAFAENVADIYVTRALKNTELLYDNQYMHTMLNDFGKDIPKGEYVDEGYTAVANYGAVKEYIQDRSKLLANLEIETMKMQGLSVKGAFNELIQKHATQLMNDMGLDTRILDDLSTPMIELSKEQVGKIQQFKPDLVKQVNDVIVQKANQSRKLQIAKDQSNFLQMYDKFTHFIKLNQTTILPAFHARNKLANTYQNWLAVGVDAFNPDFQKNAFKAVRNEGKVDGILKTTQGNLPWSEVYDMAKKYGVIDDGYFAKDLGVGTSSSGLIKSLPPKYDPTDTTNFIPYQKGSAIGGTIENQDRLIHFASQLSRGMTPEEASKSVNTFLFDYSDLTTFEKSVMKRIFPYYTWLRKNASLQLNVMLDNPKKFLYVSKVLGGIDGMINPADRINKAFVNSFAQDWVQTPWSVNNPQGKPEPVLWNPNLPFMDLNRIPDPFNLKNSVVNLFTQSNPLIKTPIEQAVNRNFFFDSPIVKDTSTTPLADRADNVASQFGMYGVASGLATKQGADLGLHILNNTTGLKFLSYDYDKYKAMKIREMLDSMQGKTPVTKPTTLKDSVKKTNK